MVRNKENKQPSGKPRVDKKRIDKTDQICMRKIGGKAIGIWVDGKKYITSIKYVKKIIEGKMRFVYLNRMITQKSK